MRSARGILSGEGPITFDNIKESCVKQLENYINVRGTINRYGLFVPSVITKIFRDKALSKHKVLNALSVIKLINKAGSLDDIQMALDEAQGDITLSKSKFTSGMAICLEKW